jgi:hypothetical protein
MGSKSKSSICITNYQPKGEKETIYLSTRTVSISSSNSAGVVKILSLQEKAQKLLKIVGYNM